MIVSLLVKELASNRNREFLSDLPEKKEDNDHKESEYTERKASTLSLGLVFLSISNGL